MIALNAAWPSKNAANCGYKLAPHFWLHSCRVPFGTRGTASVNEGECGTSYCHISTSLHIIIARHTRPINLSRAFPALPEGNHSSRPLFARRPKRCRPARRLPCNGLWPSCCRRPTDLKQKQRKKLYKWKQGTIKAFVIQRGCKLIIERKHQLL